MKDKNKIIALLIVIGIIMYGIVQFVIVPKNNEKRKKYAAEQLEPTKAELNNILKYKNSYIGNASNVINLFYNLPLADVDKDFHIIPDKLTLEVNYKDTVANIGQKKVEKALLYNSTAAFALIGNVQNIVYNFTGSSYSVSRNDIKKLYNNFDSLLSNRNWKNEVQNKLNDENYVTENFKKMFKIIDK